MHEPLTWAQRGRLWLRLGIRLALALGALAALALLPPVLSLFAPFLLAFLVAAALNPLVRWGQRKLGWSRGPLALLLVVLLFALLGGAAVGLAYGAGSEVVSLAQNWERLFAHSLDMVQQTRGMLRHLSAHIPEEVLQTAYALWDRLAAWVQLRMSGALAAAAQSVTRTAAGVPGFFLALLMFAMGSYFLTADYPYLRTRAIQRMDTRTLSALRQLHRVAAAAFGGYLKAQLLLSAGVFVILLAGFLLSGRDYALLLALLLAVVDFIPLIGAGTVMVPWAAAAFLARDYPTAISMMLTWSAVAAFRRVAEPKFVGDQTGLSPILSLVSIYVGMKLAGVAGMVLGPILTLMALNLAGLGAFHALRLDLGEAVEDLLCLLRRPGGPE